MASPLKTRANYSGRPATFAPAPHICVVYRRLCLAELEAVAIGMSLDAISRQELARENGLRQRVFHLLLDGALERPRAVHRVVSRFAQPIERRIVEHEREIAIEQAAFQVHELDVDDGADLLLSERMENADVVDAVDELRTEVLLDDFHYAGFHLRVVTLACKLLDHV